MLAPLRQDVRRLAQSVMHAVSRRLVATTAPSSARLAVATLADLLRRKGELLGENALLRQQLRLVRGGG